MERRITVPVAVCASIAALGCQTLIGADFDSARAAPTSAPGGCQLDEVPKRPADLPAATDSVDFTVVIDHMDFGDETPDAGGGADVGYDLDHQCTTKRGPPSCRQYSWLDQTPTVDGPNGRDVGIGNLFKAQRSVLPGGALIGTTEENEGVVSGATAPPGVLRIQGFSGLASDDHVVVELFQAAAFNAAPQLGAGDAGTSPRFDGTDHWPIVRETLVDPDGSGPVESTQRDDDAFVIDSTLVAHFDNVKLPMHNIFVGAVKGVITGHPVFDNKTRRWTLQDGKFAALLETKSLLAFAPLATISAVGVALCKEDALNYDLVKKILCGSADLPATDGDPKSYCTYTSLGMNFQTSPASLGSIVDVLAPKDPCPPEVDPALDTCEMEFQ